MQRKSKKRKTFLVVLVLIILILLGGLILYGPLFPWSPVKPGYTVLKYDKANVFIRDRGQLDPCYDKIDNIMREAEQLFGLCYHRRVNVIVALEYRGFGNELGRYVPWMNIRGVGGMALQTGDTVFVSHRKLVETNRVESEILRHELVHSLIFQNTSFLNTFTISSQRWLSEGVPCHFGGPYYYDEAQFKELFPAKRLIYHDTTADMYENLDAMEGKFNYTLYRFFIGHLVQHYGLDALQQFLQDYLKTPKAYREIFRAVYGKEFSAVVMEFEESWGK